MATPNPSEELQQQEAIVAEIKQQLQLYEQLMTKKKEISQTDFRAVSELNKQLNAWKQLNKSVDRVKSDLKEAEGELKSLAKQSEKAAKSFEKQQKAIEDLTENFSELDGFQKSITRRYGEQSEETSRVNKHVESIKAATGGIGKFLKKNVDLEDDQVEALTDAASMMKSMPISFDKLNKKYKRGAINQKQFSSYIEDAKDDWNEIVDRIDDPGLRKSLKEWGKAMNADAEAGKGYANYMARKQKGVATSALLNSIPGGEGISQIMDANLETNEELRRLKRSIGGAAFGAGIAQLAIGMREFIPGMKTLYYLFQDTLAPMIARAEGEVEVQKALFKRDFRLGGQLGPKYANQMFVAAEASKDFGFEMANLAAQFNAASKTAFFGHGIGSVGYAAGAMQIAGVGAEQVASALTDIASGANVNFFGTTLGAQAAVFSREMGVSTQSVADIMSAFRRMDGSSGKTALNLTYSAAKLADMKGMNVGVILNDMAQASGKLLEYNIQNKDAFVQQAIAIRQMGGNLPKFGDAMNNQIMNFQEATKAQISLSNILNRPVDLSVATALAYQGDLKGAYENIRQSGVLEAVRGGGIIAKNMFKQAMGGYGIDDFGAAAEKGPSVGLAANMNAENKSFLDRVVSAQGGLRVAQAQIAAEKAVLDAKFAQAFQEALQSSPAYREAFKTAESMRAAASAIQGAITGLITGAGAAIGARIFGGGFGGGKFGGGAGPSAGISALGKTSGMASGLQGTAYAGYRMVGSGSTAMLQRPNGQFASAAERAEYEALVNSGSKFAKLGKFAKVGGKVLGTAMVAVDAYDRIKSGQTMGQTAVGVGASVAGGAAGWALGAALAPETFGLSLLIPVVTSALGYMGAGKAADYVTGVNEPKPMPTTGGGDVITILKNIEFLVAAIQGAPKDEMRIMLEGKDITNSVLNRVQTRKGNYSTSTLNQALGNR
jgi:uncharacterized coiled-coil DUF342 family protein